MCIIVYLVNLCQVENTEYMWHMTYDTKHGTHETWCGVNNLSNFWSLALTFLDLWCSEDFEEKDHSLNEWQGCL